MRVLLSTRWAARKGRNAVPPTTWHRTSKHWLFLPGTVHAPGNSQFAVGIDMKFRGSGSSTGQQNQVWKATPCTVNIIYFYKAIKPIPTNQFPLRTTGARILTVTQCMVDYKPIPSYISAQNLQHFTFYPDPHKPIKALIHRLLINTFSWHITLGYDVTVKQMTTTRRLSPEGSIATVSLHLFLATQEHSQMP